jgi:hypothetical protein
LKDFWLAASGCAQLLHIGAFKPLVVRIQTEVLRACASLEFLQACALIHDDVMDASDTRRGKPAIHKQFEALHNTNDWNGSAKLFGEGLSNFGWRLGIVMGRRNVAY